MDGTNYSWSLVPQMPKGNLEIRNLHLPMYVSAWVMPRCITYSLSSSSIIVTQVFNTVVTWKWTEVGFFLLHAWHTIKGTGKTCTCISRTCDGKIPHKKVHYFRSTSLQMLNGHKIFGDIRIQQFVEYIHIRWMDMLNYKKCIILWRYSCTSL